MRYDSEGIEIPDALLYVTCKDTFMSGWGPATGKSNCLIFPCDTKEEAETVADNAEARSDMKYVNIRGTRPEYSNTRYFAQCKTKRDYPRWYEPGYFNKNKERRS